MKDENFWKKLSKYAAVVGREFSLLACKLYYSLQNPKTPAWAKAVIWGSLAYFISPLDAVPDFLPGVGYVDDLSVLTSAIGTVVKFVDDDVKKRAEDKVKDWFKNS